MTASVMMKRIRERRMAHHGEGRRKRRQRGMTLLEIMIVLAILGLVIGIFLGPKILEMFGEAKEDIARIEAGKYTTEAYFRWQRKNPDKSCPSNLDELATFLGKKEAKDPWGNPYIMKCGDQAPEGKQMGIQSKGPDGKENTEDDIKTWE